MDAYDVFLLNFWKTLNQFRVRYIMVGGFAVRFHGYNRSTDDIDLWIKDTRQNRKNLQRALEAVSGETFPDFIEFTFVPGWGSFYVGPGIELDILTSLKGLEDISFDTCLKNASVATIRNIQVPFLHINQLIQSKKATSRPKDMLDISALEKIRELRKKND